MGESYKTPTFYLIDSVIFEYFYDIIFMFIIWIIINIIIVEKNINNNQNIKS